MAEYRAPGLTGDWLNGWLAAVGITVLLPDVRLAWTDDPVPVALFEVPDGEDLPTKLAAAIPDEDWLDTLVISGLQLNPALAEYKVSCAVERQRRDGSLSMTYTDLFQPREKEVDRSDFYPGAPGGTTFVSRLRQLWPHLGDSKTRADIVDSSLQGSAPRIPANGLGFDIRRLPAGVIAKRDVHVLPLVECLDFFGLMLITVRGNGVRALPRGWIDGRGRARRFCWPTWETYLDQWGIDALLDLANEEASAEPLDRLGVAARHISIEYETIADKDPTTGFSSMRLP